MTSRGFQTAARGMKIALESAGNKPNEIDYIYAHGTSTPDGDLSETKAIKHLFGNHADHLLVSSTKSMTGHLFGAAGGIEAIITLKSMLEGIAPPTINYETADEQ